MFAFRGYETTAEEDLLKKKKIPHMGDIKSLNVCGYYTSGYYTKTVRKRRRKN